MAAYILKIISPEGESRYLKEFEISSKMISEEWAKEDEQAEVFDSRQFASGVKMCLYNEDEGEIYLIDIEA